MGRSCNRSMKNGNESPKKKEKEKQTYCNTIVNYITVSTTRLLYIYIYMYYTRAYLLLSTYLFTFIQRMPSHHSYCISLDLYAINTM